MIKNNKKTLGINAKECSIAFSSKEMVFGAKINDRAIMIGIYDVNKVYDCKRNSKNYQILKCPKPQFDLCPHILRINILLFHRLLLIFSPKLCQD